MLYLSNTLFGLSQQSCRNYILGQISMSLFLKTGSFDISRRQKLFKLVLLSLSCGDQIHCYDFSINFMNEWMNVKQMIIPSFLLNQKLSDANERFYKQHKKHFDKITSALARGQLRFRLLIIFFLFSFNDTWPLMTSSNITCYNDVLLCIV